MTYPDPDDWTNIYRQPPPMAVPIMMGPQGVRRLVVEFLQTELPAMYAKLQTIWNLQSDPWSVPKRYYDYEVARLDPSEFPVVVVTTPNTGRLIPDGLDYVTGDPVFRSEYPVRIFNWVRAQDVDTTVRMRDFQATAIRIAMTTKGMTVGNSSLITSPFLASVVHETFREDYSEVVGHGNGLFIAGSFASFTLAATERASTTVLADLQSAPDGGWSFKIDTYGTEGDGRESYAFP